MAKQSVVSIATPEDLCNWEFVNRFDFEIGAEFDVGDDDESIYDLVESIDSLSSSSSGVDDDDDGEEEGEDEDGGGEKDGPRIDIINPDDLGVNCSRVSDLGQNHDVDLSDCGVDLQKPDVFFEFHDGSNLNLHGYVHDDGLQHDDDDDAHDDDDDEDEDDARDDDGYGMDDELVPWEVKDRFVRQRIIKSGKNSFGKMVKSKKTARVFTRPGCVRGKHGLGLKVY